MFLVAQDLGRIQETFHPAGGSKPPATPLALSLHVALTDEISGLPRVTLCWFFRCEFRRIKVE
jgi:hypothetical protein